MSIVVRKMHILNVIVRASKHTEILATMINCARFSRQILENVKIYGETGKQAETSKMVSFGRQTMKSFRNSS